MCRNVSNTSKTRGQMASGSTLRHSWLSTRHLLARAYAIHSASFASGQQSSPETMSAKRAGTGRISETCKRLAWWHSSGTIGLSFSRASFLSCGLLWRRRGLRAKILEAKAGGYTLRGKLLAAWTTAGAPVPLNNAAEKLWI